MFDSLRPMSDAYMRLWNYIIIDSDNSMSPRQRQAIM